mmetsp:Transcript_34401/g.99101  ORF Transcript_34401/g.99101 Transcript_34401/m.99101 type:complete len:101 (+) Transcript_34401:102-404(+)
MKLGASAATHSWTNGRRGYSDSIHSKNYSSKLQTHSVHLTQETRKRHGLVGSAIHTEAKAVRSGIHVKDKNEWKVNQCPPLLLPSLIHTFTRCPAPQTAV